VVCSPAIPPFKWVDWARSLELDYRPLPLPPSSGWEAIKHRKIRLAQPRESHGRRFDDDAEALLADFHRRYGAEAAAPPGSARKLDGRLRGAVRAVSRVLDPVALPRAAEALRRAGRAPAFLSDDRVFGRRLEQLQEAVAALRRALAV
jgi:hypothetical protein